MPPNFYSFTEAMQVIGCTSKTLSTYITKWEEEFGPLPRTKEGQRLYSHSLVHLFEDRYDTLRFGRFRERTGPMSNFVRFCGTTLLDVAKEYIAHHSVAEGATELAITLLTFVRNQDQHWEAAYKRLDRDFRRRWEEEHEEAIEEMQNRLHKAEAAIGTLMSLLPASTPAARSNMESANPVELTQK